MAQLNLYVPDDIALQLRREAAAEGKSLSKFVVDTYLSPPEPRKAFGRQFVEKLKALGPLPEDFVAPSRDEIQKDPQWSFDDISA